MLTAQRHEQILHELAQEGQTVRELADSLDVSESTIRRDLSLLEQKGLLERRYGGAMLTQGSRAHTTDSGTKELANNATTQMVDFELKDRIAREAAAMVQDGDVIILDIGSTTPLIARHLHGHHVTVITSNIAVFDELRNDDAVDVVLLGGVLRRNQQSLVGPLTELAISQISADIMFLSCTGIRENYVVDNMAVEAPIKRALISSAQKVVLLASEKKFPGTGGMQLCSLNDVDVVITTSIESQQIITNGHSSGRKVIVA